MLKTLFSNKILTASMIVIFISLASIVSITKIPIEVLPTENLSPFLFVRVNMLEKSNPETVELTLGKSVEGLARTLPGIHEIRDTVDGQGTSLSLGFKPGTDLDHVTNLLTQGLVGLAQDGMFRADQVSITRSNPEAVPVLRYSVQIQNTKSIKAIREKVRSQLEAVPGVSKIDWLGTDPAIHQFSIPYSKLRGYGILPNDFQSSIRISDFVENLGVLSLSNENLPISLAMNGKNLTNFRNLSVGSKDSYLPLQMLASEKRIQKQEQDVLHLNAEPSYFLDIYAKDRANLFDLKSALETQILSLMNPPELTFKKTMDRIEDLELALDDVFSSLYQAVLITALVVFVFIRSLKKTFIIGSTIPLTVMYTILLLYLQGTSLNLLTLSGLILCIGMVVDNAILVVDRIVQKYSDGKTKLSICVGEAANEVLPALVVSSVTNALIFVPVLFIESDDEFITILKSFIVPITGSLAASVFIAVLFVPLVTLGLKLKKEQQQHTDRFIKTSLPLFRSLPKKAVSITLFSFLVSLFAIDQVLKVETAGLGSATDPSIPIKISFEDPISPTSRKKIFEQVEELLTKDHSLLQISHTVGEFVPQSLEGSISVFPVLPKGSDRDLARQDLEKKLLHWIQNPSLRTAGVNLSVKDRAGTSSVYLPSLQFEFSSLNRMQADFALTQLSQKLKDLPGVADILINRTEYTRPHLVLKPQGSYLNLSKETQDKIQTSLKALLTPRTFDEVAYNDELITSRALITGPSGQAMWRLDEVLAAPLALGKEQHFGQSLFSVRKAYSSSSIQRKSGESLATLKVKFSEDTTLAARELVKSEIDTYPFPPGMGFAANDWAARLAAMEKNTLFIVLLSCFLIYIFLASQYESFLAPFAILFTVPLALIFGVFGLWLTGYELDIMARLSLVLLVGSSVNSAILLIDVIRELRAGGLGRLEAIAQGCSRRLKAVLMTTLIQILSVLPVVFGNAKLMGLPYKTLGLVMVSGLFFSTILTLILLPLAYLGLDILEEKFKAR